MQEVLIIRVIAQGLLKIIIYNKIIKVIAQEVLNKVGPKDKDPMVNQSGAIYWYQCGDQGCDEEYIGETSGTFGERYKEHLKAPSAIHHHSIQTGHTTNQNNFQIVGREGHNLARNIKESIYIRVNNPSLNNNIGKFNLSHIWDRVLLNTKGLTLK